jgi:hypothetical protein
MFENRQPSCPRRIRKHLGSCSCKSLDDREFSVPYLSSQVRRSRRKTRSPNAFSERVGHLQYGVLRKERQ